LFYFLLKTDEGVGWWLRRAGGRFPPSLIRYREIGFFFAETAFFCAGISFFQTTGVRQWGLGRQRGGQRWRRRKRGGRCRTLKSRFWKTITSLGYLRSFLEILFNLRPNPSNKGILFRFTITLFSFFLLGTDCLALLLVPF
jgi:hypothetical protein